MKKSAIYDRTFFVLKEADENQYGSHNALTIQT